MSREQNGTIEIRFSEASKEVAVVIEGTVSSGTKTSLSIFTPDQARELGARLITAADAAEGLKPS